MAQKIQIKKYGNRRFYSSYDKKYITLSEIQNLILKGYQVQITDAESEREITSEILTQILLDQGRATHFPVELLEQLIRTSEKSLQTIWAPLLTQQFNLMTQMGEMALQGFKSFLSPVDKSIKAHTKSKNHKKT